MGEVKIELLYLGVRGKGRWIMLSSLTVISNFSVRLSTFEGNVVCEI